MLEHNAKLGEGLVYSPGLALPGAVTPYQVLHSDRAKEEIWERVREAVANDRPSRLGCFYLFADRAEGEAGNAAMFAREGRVLREARVVQGSKIHMGDMALLDVPPAEYESSARRYWAGETAAVPRPEILVFGAHYLPEWRTFEVMRPATI